MRQVDDNFGHSPKKSRGFRHKQSKDRKSPIKSTGGPSSNQVSRHLLVKFVSPICKLDLQTPSFVALEI